MTASNAEYNTNNGNDKHESWNVLKNKIKKYRNKYRKKISQRKSSLVSRTQKT